MLEVLVTRRIVLFNVSSEMLVSVEDGVIQPDALNVQYFALMVTV